jgi:hypothetical protein
MVRPLAARSWFSSWPFSTVASHIAVWSRWPPPGKLRAMQRRSWPLPEPMHRVRPVGSAYGADIAGVELSRLPGSGGSDAVHGRNRRSLKSFAAWSEEATTQSSFRKTAASRPPYSGLDGRKLTTLASNLSQRVS